MSDTTMHDHPITDPCCSACPRWDHVEERQEMRTDGLEPLGDGLEYINFVMTVLPGPDGEFVETEDSSGRGVGIGAWVLRGDGLFALRIPVPSASIRRS